MDSRTNGHHNGQGSSDWDEDQATEMLEQLGRVVRYATKGGQIEIPYAEVHHRRTVPAHDSRDWDRYIAALLSYSRAACRASYESTLLF